MHQEAADDMVHYIGNGAISDVQIPLRHSTPRRQHLSARQQLAFLLAHMFNLINKCRERDQSIFVLLWLRSLALVSSIGVSLATLMMTPAVYRSFSSDIVYSNVVVLSIEITINSTRLKSMSQIRRRKVHHPRSWVFAFGLGHRIACACLGRRRQFW